MHTRRRRVCTHAPLGRRRAHPARVTAAGGLAGGAVPAGKLLAAVADPAHFEQLEAELFDLLQHPVQGSLVLQRAAQHGLRRLHLRVEAVELTEEALTDPSSDADLVALRAHRTMLR